MKLTVYFFNLPKKYRHNSRVTDVFSNIFESLLPLYNTCAVKMYFLRLLHRRQPIFTSSARLLAVVTCFFIQSLRPATLLKKRLWRRCFPVNFAIFLLWIYPKGKLPINSNVAVDFLRLAIQGYSCLDNLKADSIFLIKRHCTWPVIRHTAAKQKLENHAELIKLFIKFR